MVVQLLLLNQTFASVLLLRIPCLDVLHGQHRQRSFAWTKIIVKCYVVEFQQRGKFWQVGLKLYFCFWQHELVMLALIINFDINRFKRVNSLVLQIIETLVMLSFVCVTINYNLFCISYFSFGFVTHKLCFSCQSIS